MVHAFVMITTGPGESEGTITGVRELTEVVDAHIVAGDYDIIAEMEVDDVYSILHAAVSKLQAMEGIDDTRTYISLN